MAIGIADLLAPVGPVEVTIFPGESTRSGDTATALEVRLQTYIDKAKAKVAELTFPQPDPALEDKLVRAWALYLTFMAAYRIANSRPATENAQVAVLGSTTYTKDQRDALLAEANEYKLEYESTVVDIPTDVVPRTPQTRSTTLTFEY